MFFSTVAAVSFLIASASAATQNVIVGANNLNVFEPNSITGNPGDTINFIFTSKNHTVTQSTFGVPCAAKEGGFDSNFIAVSNTTAQDKFPSWSITLTNTDALWIYCKQGNHCGQGMVLAINPTPDKTFDAYLTTAKASLSGNGTAPAASGSAVPSATASASAAGASGSAGATRSAGSPAASSSASALPGAPASGAVSMKAATGLLTVVAVAMGLML